MGVLSSHQMPQQPNIEKLRGQNIKGDISFATVNEYNEARKQLIRDERALGWDANAIAGASNLEQRAAKIVQKIGELDQLNVYEKSADKNEVRRLPGGHYLGNVDLINQTELLKIAQQMPKGAHLHCHYNACLPPSFLVEHARNIDAMHIRSTIPLTSAEHFENAEISFMVLTAEKAAEPKEAIHDLFNPGYPATPKHPGPWMKYSKFLEKFNGGMEAAEKYLIDKMIFREDHVHDIHQTGDGIWEAFGATTRMMKGLFAYESALIDYTEAVIQSFIDDKIQYAELRPTPPANVLWKDDASAEIDNVGFMQIIQDTVSRKIAKLKPGEIFHGVKIIYCCPRPFNKERVAEALEECIMLKKLFPDLICGFDLVGPEDRGHELHYFVPELLAFQQSCASQGISIPFLFHAGETLDCGGAVDGNLYDAVLLGAKRIGHAFSLAHHPLLMEEIKRRDIALEICPISNEVLHLTPTIAGHSLPVILANNVPCTLSSDNGAFYRSSLSHDFYQVAVVNKSMGLLGWKTLVRWSLEYSCLAREEREMAMRVWGTQWEEFVKWIVDTYEK